MGRDRRRDTVYEPIYRFSNEVGLVVQTPFRSNYPSLFSLVSSEVRDVLFLHPKTSSVRGSRRPLLLRSRPHRVVRTLVSQVSGPDLIRDPLRTLSSLSRDRQFLVGHPTPPFRPWALWSVPTSSTRLTTSRRLPLECGSTQTPRLLPTDLLHPGVFSLPPV